MDLYSKRKQNSAYCDRTRLLKQLAYKEGDGEEVTEWLEKQRAS